MKRAWILIAGLLLAVFIGACAEVQVAEAPPPPSPSVITAEDGVRYYVTGLRIPGTRQELRTKKGDASLWIPLAEISKIHFTSPAFDDYRQAEIILASREVIRVEVDTNQILEGRTEAGYWNMPLGRIRSVNFGS
ncbi:MAG: hypothetical protein QME75_07960 [Deltaproteobacteria bacterium]|nr:hypothetical protein [Deltaproteobacteria bacterium]